MRDQLEARVGALIAAARGAAGLSQHELADKARLHETSLSNMERGAKLPTLRTLIKLADALGTSVHDLIPGEPPQTQARKRMKIEAELVELIRRLPDGRLEIAKEQLALLAKVK